MAPHIPSVTAQIAAAWLLVFVMLSAPIAAWVLRKQLAQATGGARVFKHLLQLTAVATFPIAALVLLQTVVGLAFVLFSFFRYVATNW